MRLLKTSFWTILLMLSFLCVGAFADDDIPEVTQRVVRVSVVQGEAQIRRAAAGDVDSDDWERIVSNLPLVEGDEITTSNNARLEIQFDRNTYLRLGENSYLKIVNLRDEGVAVSLPQGILSLNLLRFDKDNSYFEIDAPSTTVAAQKSGIYRVDAGDSRSEEVAVTVTNGGQARIYSANSGFTLRDGRMAKVTISGAYAGEWDMQSAPRFADSFEEWILERNDVIASRLQKAKYGEYYDDDFYGAEDLNGNGEWIYTRDYGYVWRPYRNVTSVYDNWSPYRYGQWRNLPYYGWTWVNDEPWGWATYHHGRWVYYNGYWAWTPYSSRRASRSYWRPALVIFTTWGNNYCWYPLPYSYGYYDYNYYYNRRKTVIINNTTIINNYPTPTPTPAPATTAQVTPKVPFNTPIGQLPPGAIVTVAEDRFGTRGSQGFGTVSEETAKQIISKTPERLNTPPKLPTRTELDDKITKEVRAEQPTIAVKASREQIKVGATTRKNDEPIDREMREKQIFGERQPVERQPRSDKKEIDGGIGISPTTRNTGAVTRETKTDNNNNTTRTPRNTGGNSFPTNSGGTKTEDENEMRRTPRQPTFSPPPRQSPPPVKQEEPRQQPPPARQPPRQPTFDPPPRQEPPPSSPPPPKAEPPKSSPPPAKSEPAPERKTPPSPSKEEKDG